MPIFKGRGGNGENASESPFQDTNLIVSEYILVVNVVSVPGVSDFTSEFSDDATELSNLLRASAMCGGIPRIRNSLWRERFLFDESVRRRKTSKLR